MLIWAKSRSVFSDLRLSLLRHNKCSRFDPENIWESIRYQERHRPGLQPLSAITDGDTGRYIIANADGGCWMPSSARSGLSGMRRHLALFSVSRWNIARQWCILYFCSMYIFDLIVKGDDLIYKRSRMPKSRNTEVKQNYAQQPIKTYEYCYIGMNWLWCMEEKSRLCHDASYVSDGIKNVSRECKYETVTSTDSVKS